MKQERAEQILPQKLEHSPDTANQVPQTEGQRQRIKDVSVT